MEMTTCLWFNGRAREAANFYSSIFPNSSVSDNWIAPTDTPGNQQGEEIVIDYSRMLKLVKDSDFDGYIGIEYEGSPLSEPDGIRATKALLEKTWEKVNQEKPVQ